MMGYDITVFGSSDKSSVGDWEY